MKIKLPYVETIETLCLPKDFESRVKESFKRFTEGTNGDYTHHDKLLYIDNLRKHYLRNDISTEDAVKQIIADKVCYELEENGEMPAAENILSLEFMKECFEAGSMPLYGKYEKWSGSNNDKTIKAIFEIIRIVINWEDEK